MSTQGSDIAINDEQVSQRHAMEPQSDTAIHQMEPELAASAKRRSIESEESVEARIQRLGRERPAVFKSRWSEIGFTFSICMCQVLTVSHNSRQA